MAKVRFSEVVLPRGRYMDCRGLVLINAGRYYVVLTCLSISRLFYRMNEVKVFFFSFGFGFGFGLPFLDLPPFPPLEDFFAMSDL